MNTTGIHLKVLKQSWEKEIFLSVSLKASGWVLAYLHVWILLLLELPDVVGELYRWTWPLKGHGGDGRMR